jgi:hypothetical protein
VFHNAGRASCSLQGYPGVSGLGASGTPIVQAVRETGFPANVVVLAAGGEASAVVHAGAVPDGGATCPPDFAALRVTLPEETASTRLRVSLPACAGLTVRPVVAGAAGQ